MDGFDSELARLRAQIARSEQLRARLRDLYPRREQLAAQEEELREELMRQHEDYEKMSGRAALLAKDRGIELKNPGPIKKAMMWSSIKMSTLADNSRAHIAEMMVRGTVTGITALKSSLGEVEKANADEEVLSLAKELLAAEERFEKKWKSLIA